MLSYIWLIIIVFYLAILFTAFFIINMTKIIELKYFLYLFILFTLLFNSLLGIILTNNKANSKRNCTMNIGETVWNILHPIFLISFVLFLEVITKPSLYKLFSNYYGILYYRNDVSKIVKDIPNNNNNKDCLLARFYENPLLLLQNLNIDVHNNNNYHDQYKQFWKDILGIEIDDNINNKIVNIIKKKDAIGYIILLFFIGIICSIYTCNMLLLQDCFPILLD